MKIHLRNIIISFALMALLSACTTVPYSGRSQFLMTSVSEENQMGADAWQQIQSQEKVSYSYKYNSAVKRVGKNIAAVAERDDFQWEFKVFESDQPNAFCLPGGKVAVYTGLFKFTDNDAELAAVVGHEIGHAIARHGGERVSHGMLQSIGAELLAISVTEYTEAWQVAYGVATNVGGMLPYSREHEYEADYLGLIFMAKAGYNPAASLSFWDKFGKLGTTSEMEEFLSTHPIGAKRLEQMREKLPEAMKFYNECPNKLGFGRTY
jgi:metalloendopeptidase OMA1, mitochondrial